jgi:hypothetical protein
MVSARVINIKSGEPYDVYIGDRIPPFMSPTGEYLPRSIWRNPFNKAFRRGEITREEATARYREYVSSNHELLGRLPELEGKVLACWCKPDACHGDVLVELIEERKPRRGRRQGRRG